MKTRRNARRPLIIEKADPLDGQGRYDRRMEVHNGINGDHAVNISLSIWSAVDQSHAGINLTPEEAGQVIVRIAEALGDFRAAPLNQKEKP